MLELNKLLYKECEKKELNFERIKELLNKGADPLGIFNKDDDIVYDGLIYSSMDYNYNNLLKITKLFLESGMEIKNSILESKYGEDYINPLWSLAFKSDNEGIKVLKLLLDNKLEIDSAEILVDHIYTDDIFLEDYFENIKNTKEYFHSFEYAMKMIMLCASYSHIIKNSAYIRDMVEIENNNYDISKFKNYNDYYVDLEIKDNKSIIVSFKSKKTAEIVWELKELK